MYHDYLKSLKHYFSQDVWMYASNFNPSTAYVVIRVPNIIIQKTTYAVLCNTKSSNNKLGVSWLCITRVFLLLKVE